MATASLLLSHDKLSVHPFIPPSVRSISASAALVVMLQAEQGEAAPSTSRALRRRSSISPLLGVSPLDFVEPPAERELAFSDVFRLSGAGACGTFDALSRAAAPWLSSIYFTGSLCLPQAFSKSEIRRDHLLIHILCPIDLSMCVPLLLCLAIMS